MAFQCSLISLKMIKDLKKKKKPSDTLGLLDRCSCFIPNKLFYNEVKTERETVAHMHMNATVVY